MIANGNTYCKIASGSLLYKIPTEERPYVSGHVTDGSSSITFKVNGTDDITANVDSNGNFKWFIDRTITTLVYMFREITNIDKVFIKLSKTSNISSFYYLFFNCTNLNYVNISGNLTNVNSAASMFYGTKLISLELDDSFAPTNMGNFIFGNTQNKDLILNKSWFSNVTNLNRATMNAHIRQLDFSLADNCTDFSYIGQNNNYLVTLKLPNIKENAIFICGNSSNLENVEIKSTKTNMDFQKCSTLTKQSVLNLINAAAANVTYTLHSTVYNKCASGGEWYTDIQASINAKAQQGYTVTLISA